MWNKFNSLNWVTFSSVTFQWKFLLPSRSFWRAPQPLPWGGKVVLPVPARFILVSQAGKQPTHPKAGRALGASQSSFKPRGKKPSLRGIRGMEPSSEQRDGFVALGVHVLSSCHIVQGGVGGVKASDLQVGEGAVTATGHGREAGGAQLAVRQVQGGVAEGTQRVQAEAVVLHLLPNVPWKRWNPAHSSTSLAPGSGRD